MFVLDVDGGGWGCLFDDDGFVFGVIFGDFDWNEVVVGEDFGVFGWIDEVVVLVCFVVAHEHGVGLERLFVFGWLGGGGLGEVFDFEYVVWDFE